MCGGNRMCMFKNNIGRAYVNYVNSDEVEMKNADDYYFLSFFS